MPSSRSCPYTALGWCLGVPWRRQAALDLRVRDLTDFVRECAEANALNYSSMCMDVRHGRRTEIEQLNGWVERLSHRLHEGGKPLSSATHWLGKNAELAEAVRQRQP